MMPKCLSQLLAIILCSILLSNAARGADLDIDKLLQEQPEVHPSTTLEEVLLSNPIKLTITKQVPASEFPVLTGKMSLEDAVQLGLKSNLSLLSSEKFWLVSKFQARSELGKFGPTITVSPFYAASSMDQMLFVTGDGAIHAPMQPITKGSAFDLLFAGTQPLFTSGRLLGGYKAARAVERQSLGAYQAFRLSTALKVKEAYLESAWNEAQLRVASDYVKYRRWSVGNMKIRLDQGKVPKADYLREEAELSKAQDQLNKLYRAFNISLLKLKVALGVDPISQIDLRDQLDFAETPNDVNFYLSEAVRNRPEIAQAEQKVREMKARVLVAASNILPQVNLYGLASNTTGSAPGVTGSVDGRWGAFVGILGSWTVFESGVHVNQMRAWKAAVDQAELAKKDIKLKVSQDVWQAWIDLVIARRNVDLSKAEVVSAQEDHRLFQARYTIGKASSLEDFDATIKLYQSRLALLEAIYNYRLAQVRLIWAGGGI